jgi:hypothetical protein
VPRTGQRPAGSGDEPGGTAASAAGPRPPFVNLRDPARALGPDGQTRRQPPRSDLGGRPRREVERLALAAATASTRVEEIGRVLNLTDDERAGLSSPDKFRVDITPYFLSLIDPDDPNDPIRRQVIPTDCEHEAFTAMMEDSLAEDRHSPVPGWCIATRTGS